MNTRTTVSRYNSFAIILHWVMAWGFFLMLGSGVVMTYGPIEQSLQFNIYQWHKAGGVLLLLAFALRIAVACICCACSMADGLYT